jgi:hypothetical protein
LAKTYNRRSFGGEGKSRFPFQRNRNNNGKQRLLLFLKGEAKLKKLDFISILVAAVFGAALVAVVISLLNENSPDTNPTLTQLALAGLLVGAGVQTGVRLTGVS